MDQAASGQEEEWYPQRTASVSATLYQLAPPPPGIEQQQPQLHHPDLLPGQPPPPAYSGLPPQTQSRPYYPVPQQPQGPPLQRLPPQQFYPPQPQPHPHHHQPAHNQVPQRPYGSQQQGMPPAMYYRQLPPHLLHTVQPRPGGHVPPPTHQQPHYAPGPNSGPSPYRQSMMPPPQQYLHPPPPPLNRGPSPGYASSPNLSHRQSVMLRPAPTYDLDSPASPPDMTGKRDSVISAASSNLSSASQPRSPYDHYQQHPSGAPPEFVPYAHVHAMQQQLGHLQRRLSEAEREQQQQPPQQRTAPGEMEQLHSAVAASEEKIRMLQDELNVAIAEITRLTLENDELRDQAAAGNAAPATNKVDSTPATATSAGQPDSELQRLLAAVEQAKLDGEQTQKELSAARAAAADAIRLRTRTMQLEAELAHAKATAGAAGVPELEDKMAQTHLHS
ncbi:hypothetical protein HDU87_004314 [Geranomyces variabilis]|uniref:Uncharacterized protein n=1 Tax=Geranomyces variabilis TaxID=109894 RepID=A0AAD5TL44_9FUNG|nr:hypothetical protein HDU87_004314 [Geranomyces variabilis]